MKVTRNLLTKLQAYKHWFDVFQKYNDEVELVTLLKDPDLSIDDLYFARHYFPFTNLELAVYNERCNIIECGDHILYSSNIKNSNWIYYSNNIENSNFISNGENIKGSSEIKSAIEIINSDNVINSKVIKYSNNIADSNNVTTSSNIINSSYINWSDIINSSQNLDECQFCYKCNNLTDCYFCGFVDNSKHCMFCNNISSAEYQVFNQPVTANEYETLKETLIFQLSAENVKLIKIDEDRHLDARFSYDLRFDRMFEQLSEKFYGWVGSLPQYDEQIFFLLFFTTLK